MFKDVCICGILENELNINNNLIKKQNSENLILMREYLW